MASEVAMQVSVRDFSIDDLCFLGNVVVVNCGGTINMGIAPGRGPAGVLERKLEELREEMATLGIGIQTEKVFDRPPDSSNIGESEWATIIELLSAINRSKESIARRLRLKGVQLEKGGIVVGHGTDTLQITALIAALEFSVKSLSVPIIFTGSHAPMEAKGSDGLANLRKSIYVAKERFSAENNLLPAVYVLIGQDVHLASRLTKVRTAPDSDGRYFFSFPTPVGRITGENFHLRINEAYIRRMLPTAPAVQLQEQARRPFGVVEHIILDRFSVPSCLDDMRRRVSYYLSQAEFQGRGMAVVVQGDFSSNPAFPILADNFASLAVNTAVFVGSRKTFEKLKEMPKSDRIMLLPKSMTHAKAQAKLRWLLSFTGTDDELGDLIGVNFAGEISDTEDLPEWINYETFPDNIVGTEVIIAYPNIHWKVVDDAGERLRGLEDRHKAMYLYGFGDGHIPAINRPICQIVRGYLEKELLGCPELGDDTTLDVIVESIASHLAEKDPAELRDYLVHKYRIEERHLRTVLVREIVASIRTQEVEQMRLAIEGLVRRSARKGVIEIRMRNPEMIINTIIENLRISVVGGRIETLLGGIKVDKWSRELVESLQQTFGMVLARRIVKDSVMSASKLLSVIGEAVDDSIRVVVRTLAVKSRSNTMNYEAGNLLMILGVDSDEIPGWNTLYFIPRG